MDVGDDDLFAVFDSDSAKAQQIVIPEDEEEKTSGEDSNPLKFDTGNLVAEICGGTSKRAVSEVVDTSGGYKKVKTESGMTIMTGLTDKQIKEKMEADAGETKEVDVSDDEKIDDEEDQTVVSLVEAAPRIKIHTLETPSSCTHEVAVPPNCEFSGLREPVREPAKNYPFTLDPFQTQFSV